MSKDKSDYPKHVGGGLFELSSGDRVEGKNTARMAERNIDQFLARKNGDRPAYPLQAHGLDTGKIVEYYDKQDGLTKREKIVTELLSGILSNPNNKSKIEDKVNDAMVATDIILRRMTK